MPRLHKNKKVFIPTEDEEQAAVINWAKLQEGKYPCLKWLYAIPNGGSRGKREAAKFKRTGVKSGVSDLCLPVARGGYHALYVEIKALDGKTEPTQREFIMDMKDLGNQAVACWGFEAAKDELLKYLNSEVI